MQLKMENVGSIEYGFLFHIPTVHLDNMKVSFIHQGRVAQSV